MAVSTPVSTIEPADSLLLLDRLRLGDVILLRSHPKPEAAKLGRIEPDAIAAFGGGEFSHAALVVRGGLWYDSDDEGVGENSFPPAAIVKVERHADVLRPFVDTSCYAAFRVYRHPDFPDGTRPDVEERVVLALLKYHAHEYPPLENLASAASGLSLLGKEIARLLLPHIERYGFRSKTERVLPGPFCSQLVVSFYQALGLRLFDRERGSATVSPSDLAESRLELVTDCYGNPDADLPDVVDDKEQFHVQTCRIRIDGKSEDVEERVTGELVVRELSAIQKDPERVQDLDEIPTEHRGRRVTVSDDGVPPWVVTASTIDIGGTVVEAYKIWVDTMYRPLLTYTVIGPTGEPVTIHYDQTCSGEISADYFSRRTGSRRYMLARVG